MTQEKAIHLTAHIRDVAREGMDRFRYVARWFQRLCMERFLSQPDAHIIAEAKRCCRVGVNRATSADSGRHKPIQIISGLDTSKPTVPRFRIERAAFLNYCGRIENGRSGCAEDDWTSAEKGLQEAYKEVFR